MGNALKAVRREIAETQRHLIRLRRSEEILAGQRGITGAPANEQPEHEQDEHQKEIPEHDPAEGHPEPDTGEPTIDPNEEKEHPDKPVSEPEKTEARRNGQKRLPGELVADIERLFSDGKGRTASEAAKEIGAVSTTLYRPLRMHPKIKEDDSQFPAIFKMKVRESVTRPGEGVRSGRLK